MNWKNKMRIGWIMISLGLLTGGMISYQKWQNKRFLPIEGTKAVSQPYMTAKAVTRARPLGMVMGIYVKTQGIIVLDVTPVYGSGNEECPAKGILKKGDYLLKCNGKKLTNKERLMELVDASKGKAVRLEIRRNGKLQHVLVKPKRQGEHYRLGAWVRDDMAGLGTMTLCTQQNEYFALGHAISDMDLNTQVRIRQGSIHPCHITDVRKGKPEFPGALIGYIDYQPEKPVGSIQKNSASGIAGRLFRMPRNVMEEPFFPLAKRKDVHTGDAEFISDFSGKRQRYTMKITHINHFSTKASKGFVLEITDTKLKREIGGIVQGLSGSPILQDGKIVGAITHVFVHNPQRGYGIFVEDMLE
ncbi:stage IV sporulation protein B [Lachnospiraceae bacterium XBB1006]|nr:stage IV sporulation protein B [Lachnospiraceae bacterium XBB1006]